MSTDTIPAQQLRRNLRHTYAPIWRYLTNFCKPVDQLPVECYAAEFTDRSADFTVVSYIQEVTRYLPRCSRTLVAVQLADDDEIYLADSAGRHIDGSALRKLKADLTTSSYTLSTLSYP